MNSDSYYKNFANQNLKWLPCDTEELFQQNLQTKYNLLQRYGWIDRSFNYSFNSFGFRCNEFTDNPSVMFLGCSYTIGIGLPIENVWASLIAKKLNLQSANLAIGGSSPDTAFRMCLSYIDKVNPRIVIYMNPPGIRTELVTDNKISNMGIGHNQSWKKKSIFDNWLEVWAQDDNNHFFNNRKNSLAIEMLCHQRNIKFVSVDSKELTARTLDLARDLMHIGELSHKAFADYFINQI